MAQTALYDAKFVARNIQRSLDGKLPKPYQPKKPVYITSVGKRWAAVLWGKVQIYGQAGWLLRELADFVAFRDIEPLLPASEQWFSEFEDQEDCPTCAQSSATI